MESSDLFVTTFALVTLEFFECMSYLSCSSQTEEMTKPKQTQIRILHNFRIPVKLQILKT